MWRWRSITARRAPGGEPWPWLRGRAGAALALHERPVLAHQQIEVCAFFVGELQEDLLAFRVLELLAVLLEEAVRAALAADADHQCLLIVDAAHQPFGAIGEQSVRRALEEQERRPRLELRVALEQLAVARLELAQVLLLLARQILENLAAARVLGDAGGAGVELQAAALGGDRDAQRVAREEQVAYGPAGLPYRPVRHSSQVP